MTAEKKSYDIQELVTESGVPRRTVYFYVQQGILPPPQGAGLAAYYTGEHLLRLKMIPILRSQGLRLDDIRTRLAGMTLEEMETAVQAGLQPPAALKVHQPDEWSQPMPRKVGEGPVALPGWNEQSYLHYQLPAGITVTAPAALNPADRQRLNLLLQAARQIFNGAGPVYFALHNSLMGQEPGSSTKPDDDTGSGGNHA